MNTADRCAHVLVGGSRYRASIKDNNLSNFRVFGANESAIDELAFNGGSIGLCGATSEVFNVEPRHDLVYYIDRREVTLLAAWGCQNQIQLLSPLAHPTVHVRS
jgi:hypothetical protein